MEIALLQHKSRPNLPFSPTWWLQHGKVCLYLRPGLEAVTLLQCGNLSHTGSMSVWQGQLTSLQVASNVLQGVRKMFPLSLPPHTHFSCCNLGMLPVVCACVGVSTIQPGCPRFYPWAWREAESSLSAEVPSQGTCQAVWVGTWDPTGSVYISQYKYSLFARAEN